MCMAIPSRVVALQGENATVEAFGNLREVSLMLLHEAVTLGDYLLVQAGGFACERVEPNAALETLQMLSEIIASAPDNA